MNLAGDRATTGVWLKAKLAAHARNLDDVSGYDCRREKLTELLLGDLYFARQQHLIESVDSFSNAQMQLGSLAPLPAGRLQNLIDRDIRSAVEIVGKLERVSGDFGIAQNA